MKRIAALVVFAAAVSVAGTSFAAFSSLGKSTVTATVTTGGTPTVSTTLTIKNVTAPEGANQTEVTWTGVTAGSTEWKIAEQLLRLDTTITASNGGVQIYTDNKEAGANPKFVDATPLDLNNPDSNPAGLVSVTDTGDTLSLAWAIKDSSHVVEGAGPTGIRANDPNENNQCGRPDVADAYQWLFMSDASSPAIDFNGDGDVLDTDPVADCPNPDTVAFVPGNTFSTMINRNGFHFGQGPANFGGSPTGIRYVYLQADFTPAFAQEQYKTNRLIVETFTN
jgi:hypothetical protein